MPMYLVTILYKIRLLRTSIGGLILEHGEKVIENKLTYSKLFLILRRYEFYITFRKI